MTRRIALSTLGVVLTAGWASLSCATEPVPGPVTAVHLFEGPN